MNEERTEVTRVAMFAVTPSGDSDFIDVYSSVEQGLEVAEKSGIAKVCFTPWEPVFYTYGGWNKVAK